MLIAFLTKPCARCCLKNENRRRNFAPHTKHSLKTSIAERFFLRESKGIFNRYDSCIQSVFSITYDYWSNERNDSISMPSCFRNFFKKRWSRRGVAKMYPSRHSSRVMWGAFRSMASCPMRAAIVCLAISRNAEGTGATRRCKKAMVCSSHRGRLNSTQWFCQSSFDFPSCLGSTFRNLRNIKYPPMLINPSKRNTQVSSNQLIVTPMCFHLFGLMLSSRSCRSKCIDVAQ